MTDVAGEKITVENGKLNVPNYPYIPFIRGDGIGMDIWPVVQKVVDAAVAKAYGNKDGGMVPNRAIQWIKIYAGEEANEKHGNYLPQETVDAIKSHVVAIKGPLTTPVGGGFRSLNVALRQKLDLYCCVRPSRWFNGVPNPMKHPEKLNVVMFRENSEDIYLGIEWKQGSPEAKKVIDFVNNDMGAKKVREDSGIGVKPISIFGTKRLVQAAIQYAIDNNRNRVTLVHKGNIMKFTEGAFREWGYEVAKEKFGDRVITEKEVWDSHDGKIPEGKIMINDRIADAMFQQILLRPDEYQVLATMNLNGDYISDACAAQVGGLGIAPGANINYTNGLALFEATHGTAPKHAGKDKVNPGSLILSAVMMLDYLGWGEAARLIENGFEKTIGQKTVTYDLARQIDGATEVKCSEFGEKIISNL